MNWISAFAATFIGMSGTFGFLLKCPENRAKFFRPGSVCQRPSEYHCLMNSSSKLYIETCKTMSWMDEAVLNNLQIHFEPCIHQEFQPFVILSTEVYKCAFTKDLCAEKGQVIFSNGTEKTNRRCRCDYRKGFSFVIQPKQNCYCDPVQEDCSCFLVDCGYNKQLYSDYICRNKSESNRTKQMCPEITKLENDVSIDSEPNDYTDTNNVNISSVLTVAFKIIVVFAVFIFCIGMTTAFLSGRTDTIFQNVCTRCYKKHKRSDIIVLGVEREVKDFIKKLRKITSQKNIDPVLHANDEKTRLDVLLKTYRFIFILYTEEFDRENIGLSEDDMQKLRCADKYKNIKIVCNCEKGLVEDATGRIDLDFKNQRLEHFEEKNSEYHKILKKLPMPKRKRSKKKKDHINRQTSVLSN